MFNSLGHARSDLLDVALPGGLAPGHILYQQDQPLEWQSAGGERILVSGHRVPGFGYTCLSAGPAREVPGKPETSLRVSRQVMENRFFRMEFDEGGLIASLYHKSIDREYVKAGSRANCFQAFEDLPPDHDAWNIDPFYRGKYWTITELNTLAILEEGPLRGTMMMERPFGRSIITQHIRIYRDMDRIDFVTKIAWWENNTMLKVLFPVDLATDQAACEIQFGYLYRPTHTNTPWEKAKFEVCAQRWVDVSEKDWGIALINNGKYGHDITRGVIGLTCLRSPSYPDSDADRGQHEFAYALFPHQGTVGDAPVTERAAEFNEPLIPAVKGNGAGSWPPERSWITLDNPAIVLAAVKLSEYGEGVIVRVYESRGKRVAGSIAFWKPPVRAWSCTLLEMQQEEIPVRDRSLTLHFHPFEIKTLMVFFDR